MCPGVRVILALEWAASTGPPCLHNCPATALHIRGCMNTFIQFQGPGKNIHWLEFTQLPGSCYRCPTHIHDAWTLDTCVQFEGKTSDRFGPQCLFTHPMVHGLSSFPGSEAHVDDGSLHAVEIGNDKGKGNRHNAVQMIRCHNSQLILLSLDLYTSSGFGPTEPSNCDQPNFSQNMQV